MKNKKIYKNIRLLFLLFFIGAILGWLYEEIYFFVTEQKITYRGSLWGPWLPVYGIGELLFVWILEKHKKHPSIIFIGSIIITGIIEYITGYLIDVLLNTKYWDYSLKPFNLNGYICLESVLLFGILALIFIYIVKPQILKITNKLKEKQLNMIFIISLSIFILDLIISIFYRCPYGMV